MTETFTLLQVEQAIEYLDTRNRLNLGGWVGYAGPASPSRAQRHGLDLPASNLKIEMSSGDQVFDSVIFPANQESPRFRVATYEQLKGILREGSNWAYSLNRGEDREVQTLPNPFMRLAVTDIEVSDTSDQTRATLTVNPTAMVCETEQLSPGGVRLVAKELEGFKIESNKPVRIFSFDTATDIVNNRRDTTTTTTEDAVLHRLLDALPYLHDRHWINWRNGMPSFFNEDIARYFHDRIYAGWRHRLDVDYLADKDNNAGWLSEKFTWSSGQIRTTLNEDGRIFAKS